MVIKEGAPITYLVMMGGLGAFFSQLFSKLSCGFPLTDLWAHTKYNSRRERQ